MTDRADPTYKQLSLSGFPFQLRVEAEVAATESQHKWRVVAREQAWRDPETSRSGFIDIVLQHTKLTTLRMVVECKRQRAVDARALQWLFLIPEQENDARNAVRCLTVDARHYTRTFEEFDDEVMDTVERERKEWVVLRVWDDVRITPPSLESQFCVMQSDESRRQSILESLCGELLDSVDGLAAEEAAIAETRAGSRRARAFYMPVVVTNAQLRACFFDVESVSLGDGVIPEDKCRIETVPFIRFRKSLANTALDYKTEADLQQANRARERTVFVVNAESLTKFLTGWDIQPMDDFYGYALVRLIEQTSAEQQTE